MAVDGLWTTELFGLWGWEHRGVLILKNGRALGGGNNHHAVGTYSVAGNAVEVSLSIDYHGTPQTLFGSTERRFDVLFAGRLDGDRIEGEVARTDRRELKLPFRLTRRAELD